MLTVIQDGQPTKARTERRAGHFWADNEIIEDYLPDLSIYAFSIYMILCYYARSKTGRAWPSIPQIAKHLKVSEPTVRKGLNELSEAKLIVVTPNYKISKKGTLIQDNYTFTLSEVAKHVRRGGKPRLPGGVNGVDQGGKPRLPGGVNGVDPNNTYITKRINKTKSTKKDSLPKALPSAGSAPEKPEEQKPDRPTLKEVPPKTPSVASVPPLEDAPPKTRWIYPQEGGIAHLVRDANQPTVTLCGIRPLPSYGGMTTPGKYQPCAACLAKATNRTPEHMLPIAAWCNALEDKIPKTFNIGTFARVSKEWTEKGIAADEVRCAGLLFKAWIEAHPAAPSVSWQVKDMRGNVDQALALHREGIESSDVATYVKALKDDRFWSGKIVPFDYVCRNIPTWKVENAPAQAKQELVEHPDHPGEMITRGRYNRIMADKQGMEILYGHK